MWLNKNQVTTCSIWGDICYISDHIYNKRVKIEPFWKSVREGGRGGKERETERETMRCGTWMSKVSWMDARTFQGNSFKNWRHQSVCGLADSVTPHKCLAFWLTSNDVNISNKV